MEWFNRSRLLFLILLIITACQNDSDYNKLKIVYMFDDAHITDYTVALKIFNELEIKYNCKISATTYVFLAGLNYDALHCNVEQLKELRDSGWEIGSHSMTHPIMTLLSEEELLYEIRGSRDSLRKLGFNPLHFAFPSGVCNDSIRRLVHQYYMSSRDTDDRFFSEPLDLFYFGCYMVPWENTVISIKRRIDLAIQRDEDFVIILFHKLGYGYKQVTPEAFEEITEIIIRDYSIYPISLENISSSEF